jgi:signal transduction histidine kinase
MNVENNRRDWPWHVVFTSIALLLPFLIGFEIIDQFRTPAVDFTLDWQTGVIQAVPMQSSANISGFMPGDIILAVNGIPYAEWKNFSLGVSRLEIRRGDQRLTLELPIYPLIKYNWRALCSAILVALTFWGTSIWLLLRRFFRMEIRILFLAGQAVAVALLAPMANLSSRMADWPIDVSVSALYLSAPLILHHYLTFPVALGSARQRSKILLPLYALWLAAFGGWLWGGFWGRQFGTIYTVVIIIAALLVMGYVYLRRASPADRRRLRLIVIGALLAGIPAIFFYLLPDILQLPHRLPLWVVGPFTVLAPLSYLYAILRHNLFGIDRLLNRTLVYVILSLGILALYIGPYLLIYRLLQGDPLFEILLVVGLAMLIGISFDWTRLRVQRLVDRLFYGGWYDYPGVVESISNTLARCIEREQLSQVLTRQAPALMQLQEGRLWIGNPGEAPPSRVDPAQLEWELSFQGERRGLWIVAPRSDGEDFSENDHRILKTIASQAETALGNVLLIETLRRQLADIHQIQRQLLRSREDERARLARDLHDGPLQVLVGLNMQLGMLLSAPAPSSSIPTGEGQGVKEVIQPLRDEVRSLLTELRQVCTELRPPMLDTLGLGAALRALAEEWSTQSGLKTRLDLPEDASLRSLSGETAVNLYRVAQEALSNVARHAAARQATLSLAWKAEQLEMIVQDDGKGFTLPRTSDALTAAGHYGLAGMQERVGLIGGQLAIETAPGKGTTIRVTWVER